MRAARYFLPVILTAGVLLAAPSRSEAQATASASCVGGAIGCEQVDLFVTLLSGAPMDISSFSINLTTTGWLFSTPPFFEIDDAFGLILAEGTLSADRLTFTGNFILDDMPAFATLDPTIRMRGEFDAFGADVSSLGFTFQGRDANGQPIIDARFGAMGPGDPSVVPEPATVFLVGGGLSVLAFVARRRVTPTA